MGCGSSEVLHTSVDAFTSPDRPLISVSPAYEGPIEVARALGRPVVLTPPARGLHRRREANWPRRPTSAKRRADLSLQSQQPNLRHDQVGRKSTGWWPTSPRDTMLLVDEAYIHFGESPDLKARYLTSARGRTSSSHAPSRRSTAWRACAPVSPPPGRRSSGNWRRCASTSSPSSAPAPWWPRWPTATRSSAARRAALAKTRRELCDWLRERDVKYIQPHANFIMIDCGRNAREFIAAMPQAGRGAGPALPAARQHAPRDHRHRRRDGQIPRGLLEGLQSVIDYS